MAKQIKEAQKLLDYEMVNDLMVNVADGFCMGVASYIFWAGERNCYDNMSQPSST